MITIKAGTRGSKLALVQTRAALDAITELLPPVVFEMVTMSSPGDRDKSSDLRSSDPDFFTRDLDDAVLDGHLGCAVHSAKDLPERLREGIDFVWLPWVEDHRDVLILREGETLGNLPPAARIGISSARREEYCRRRFPAAELPPIRGNVEERVAQLDAGKFDLLIMAAAGLNRLGLADRITEFISSDELPPPHGQGHLAMTFKKGDPVFTTIRKLFVKTVTIAGAGASADLITRAAMSALSICDYCLYDSLMDPRLLELLKPGAKALFVGKRKGEHSMAQTEICELLTVLARQGFAVVRLKGGDPGVFGRLAEEVVALDELSLPYRVVPGVTSLLAATTGTGLNLTRRGAARGFTALTPRREGSSEFSWPDGAERLGFPTAFFMGVSEVPAITGKLMAEGRRADEPAALVYNAGMSSERIVAATLGTIAEEIAGRRSPPTLGEDSKDDPGLLLVGETFDQKHVYKRNGALGGCRVLLTCAERMMAHAVADVLAFGGVPVEFPLIKAEPNPACRKDLERFGSFDWIVLTSPSAVCCLFELLEKFEFDARRLPRVMVCGPGTATALKEHSLFPDLTAERDFGGKGLLEAAAGAVKKGERILRLRSDLAESYLAEGLAKLGAEVDDCILYFTRRIVHERLPAFDAVFFASGSAANAFVDAWSVGGLDGKRILAIGGPTRDTLVELGVARDRVVVPPSATCSDAIRELARKILLTKFSSTTFPS